MEQDQPVLPKRRGRPPKVIPELSIEEMPQEIEVRKPPEPPREIIPEGSYPNFYWECIDAETSGRSNHPVYKWVGPPGGSPSCPVCGSNRAWERGTEPPKIAHALPEPAIT